jgi:hypothetical protein
MPDYIEGILEEALEDMDQQLCWLPPTYSWLGVKRAKTYNHLMAKLLYLCKRAHPDLQTVILFLTTRVTWPDEDDW